MHFSDENINKIRSIVNIFSKKKTVSLFILLILKGVRFIDQFQF